MELHYFSPIVYRQGLVGHFIICKSEKKQAARAGNFTFTAK